MTQINTPLDIASLVITAQSIDKEGNIVLDVGVDEISMEKGRQFYVTMISAKSKKESQNAPFQKEHN